MSEGTFSIPLDDEIVKFRQHLDANDRVIFSAQFGDGKTTFLKEFIEKSQKDCFFITLHPVNYSVATNEDIFEYIKRDILVQLNKEGVLPELDLNAVFENISSWAYFEPVLSFVLNQVPYGPFVKKAIDIGKKIKEDYDIKKNTFGKYEESFVNQRGGLYEDDGYTQLIKAGIHHIQTNKEGKKVILIIEDLDRIDPGHLFRILNVLGAHIDIEEQNKNKFGFDKIIAVLDYNVTKHIFAHFYGQEANYEGYMSKFYSHYKYDYSITKVAQRYLRDYIKDNTNLPDSIFSVTLYRKNVNEDVTLDNCISELSVRRVVQILDGIKGSIRRSSVYIGRYGDVVLCAPIVPLLSVIVRLNVPFSGLYFINSMKQIDITLRMLDSFLFINDEIANGVPFIYNHNAYFGQGQLQDTSLFAIFNPIRDNGSYRGITDSEIKRAFNTACSYVQDCQKFNCY